jgi:hypothetical protein
MKTSKNATTPTSDISPATTTQAATPEKIYIFSSHQAATPLLKNRRWEQSEHIEDFRMLARLKTLSNESKSQVVRLVDELYAREIEERKLREIGKSRKLLAQAWDNPSDAEYNDL